MSWVDVREAVRDSPERARSLLTVRAAISSARPVEAPRSFALSLMCSYWRARFVPFFTPLGGMCRPSLESIASSRGFPCKTTQNVPPFGLRRGGNRDGMAGVASGERTYAALRRDAPGCRACDLWRLGTQTVFG